MENITSTNLKALEGSEQATTGDLKLSTGCNASMPFIPANDFPDILEEEFIFMEEEFTFLEEGIALFGAKNKIYSHAHIFEDEEVGS